MWRRATPVKGCTPGWSTVGERAARGMRGAPRGPCQPPGQHHSRGLYDDPLRRSAVAAPGVQGHFRLARMGDSVDGLLDLHAAARGLIQNPALRHPVAQGGARGRVPHRGQSSVIGAGSEVSLGASVFSGATAPFPRGAEGCNFSESYLLSCLSFLPGTSRSEKQAANKHL